MEDIAEDAARCENTKCGGPIPENRRSPYCSTKCYRRCRYLRLGGAEHGYAVHLANRYGMTAEEYRRRVDKQQGRCAVCGDPPGEGKRLHVDHDHESGAIRDLLCGPCNHALGHAKDDPARLRALAAYLEGHTSKIV